VVHHIFRTQSRPGDYEKYNEDKGRDRLLLQVVVVLAVEVQLEVKVVAEEEAV
jgi:hypothetical protein